MSKSENYTPSFFLFAHLNVERTKKQEMGERAGKEPLKTLSGFRRFEKQVFFGRYVLSSSIGGIVKVGDSVEMLVSW